MAIYLSAVLQVGLEKPKAGEAGERSKSRKKGLVFGFR